MLRQDGTPPKPDQLTRDLLTVVRRQGLPKISLHGLRHCPDRVHTILPGIVLMDALTEALCEGELYISPYGVREGYLCHKLLNAGT